MLCEKHSEKKSCHKSRDLIKSREINKSTKSRDNKSKEQNKLGDYVLSLPMQNESKTIKRSFEKSRVEVEEKENQRRTENKAHQRRLEDDLREELSKLQMKLMKKNEELAFSRQEIIDLNLIRQEDKRVFMAEKQELERTADILRQQINEERDVAVRLKLEYDRMLHQLEDTSRIKQHLEQNTHQFDKVQTSLAKDITEYQKEIQQLRVQIQSKDNKILNFQDDIEDLKVKNKKLKEKLNFQKKDLLEAQLEDAKRHKYKNEEVRSQIQTLEERQVAIQQENKSLKLQNDSLKKDNKIFKEKLEELSKEQEQLQQKLKKYIQEKQEAQEQVEKMDDVLRKYQIELTQIEKETFVYQEQQKIKETQVCQIQKLFDEEKEQCKRYWNEILQLQQENKIQKDLIEKMEKQSQMIVEVQVNLYIQQFDESRDFEQLEMKVEKISKETLKQKQENEYLKDLENNLKKELEYYRAKSEKLKQVLEDQKKRNNNLQYQMDDLDQKLRQMVQEKNLELAQMKRKGVLKYPQTSFNLKTTENFDKLRKSAGHKDLSDSDSSNSD